MMKKIVNCVKISMYHKSTIYIKKIVIMSLSFVMTVTWMVLVHVLKMIAKTLN